MDEHGSTGTGGVTLHELDAGNVDARLSNDYFSGGTWRNDQVVRVDTGKSTSTGKAGTWSVDNANNVLSFQIDQLLGTDFHTDVGASGNLAINWAMTCANDVVSGEISGIGGDPNVPVPEPGILALLCSGIGGLAWSRRRKLAK